MATKLQEFRAKYPGAYDAMPDTELADRLYTKFYSTMDRREFDARIGINPYDNVIEATGTALQNVPGRMQMAGAGLQQAAAEGVTDMLSPPGLNPGVEPLIGVDGQPVPVIPADGGAGEILRNVLSDKGEAALAEAAAMESLKAQLNYQQLTADQKPVDAAPGSVEGYVAGAIGSVAEMAPGLALSILMRSPAPAMIAVGGQVGGASYAEGRAEGLPPGLAREYAALNAAAEAIPEALPLGVLLRPGTKFLTRLVKGAAAEAVQESVTEALQIGIDLGYLNPDMTWGEAQQRMQDAAIMGAIAGPLMGAVAHPAQKVVDVAYDAAAQGKAAIQQLFGTVPRTGEPKPAGPSMIERINQKLVDRGFAPTNIPEPIMPAPVPTEEANPATTQQVEVFEYAPNGEPRDPATGYLMDQSDPRYAAARAASPMPVVAQPQAPAAETASPGTTAPAAPEKPPVSAASGPYTGDASGLLRGFEGFIAEPKWDVNAYRVGYGSDTITRADGSVVKVEPGMTVTREDAERDLARRAADFAAAARNDIGPEIWDALPSNVQAALTSNAYNYGSLQKSIIAAAQSGDINAIAAAVDAQQGHNDGINAGRRAKEAAIIRGEAYAAGAGATYAGGGTAPVAADTAPVDPAAADIAAPTLETAPSTAAPEPVQPPPAVVSTPSAPVTVETAADVEAVRQDVNTDPTPAQIEAGNYRKGHVKLNGYDITIETPKGAMRRGTNPNGTPWEVAMPADYGYIKRTTGADGDHIDVYIGPEPDAKAVFVVDQVDAETGAFDEHKVIVGVRTRAEAELLYKSAFSDGKGAARMGNVAKISQATFDSWIKDGDHSKPFTSATTAKTAGKVKAPAKPKAVPFDVDVDLPKDVAGLLRTSRATDEIAKLASEGATDNAIIEAFERLLGNGMSGGGGDRTMLQARGKSLEVTMPSADGSGVVKSVLKRADLAKVLRQAVAGKAAAPAAPTAPATAPTPKGMTVIGDRAETHYEPAPPVVPEPGEELGVTSRRTVIERGKAAGVEFLLAFDGKTLLANGRGLKGFVGFNRNIDYESRRATSNLVVHHNHPGSSSFSGGDVSVAFETGVAVVWAHGHDGSAYRLEVPKAAKRAAVELLGPSKDREIARVVKALRERFNDMLVDIAHRNGWDSPKYSKQLSHLAMVAMHDAGLVDYQTDVEVDAAVLAHADYENLMRRATFEARSSIAGPGASDNYRPAERVRYPADVGTIPGWGDEAAKERPTPAVNDSGRGKGDSGKAQSAVEPGFPVGDVMTVTAPTGQKIEVQPVIIDAEILQKATGELQPRDRSRAASDAQIEDIAINLDPDRLLPSREADRGAPIIGPDNVVESGNGRRMAVLKASRSYQKKYLEYVKAMGAAGFKFPAMAGTPILVLRRVTPMTDAERIEFVNAANSSAIARMSATEQAVADARLVADGLTTVKMFLGKLPQSERASLTDADGNLNADGQRRYQNAMLAAAYGDAATVAKAAEATDDNARSITGALVDVSADWIGMRRDIEAAKADPAYDMTDALVGALKLLDGARTKAASTGTKVKDEINLALGQVDIFSGNVDPLSADFVEAFYSEGFARAKSRDKIAALLRAITSEVGSAIQPQLLGAAPSPQEVIGGARRKTEREEEQQGALFASRAPRGRPGDGREGDGNGSVQRAGAQDQLGAGDSTGTDGKQGGMGVVPARAAGDAVERSEPDSEDRSGQADDRQQVDRRWFSNSKVVDANGKPLVVYHGSPVAGITAFDLSKLNDKTRGTGIWFTSDEGKAGSYFDADRNGEVYPVYLKMERPIVVQWDGHWADGPAVDYVEYRITDAIGARVGGSGYYEERKNAEAELARLKNSGVDVAGYEISETPVRGEQTTDEWVRRLRRANPDADGVILRNVQGGGDAAGGFAGLVSGDEYVVFDPSQVMLAKAGAADAARTEAEAAVADQIHALGGDLPMPGYVGLYSRTGVPRRPASGKLTIAGRTIDIPDIDAPQRREGFRTLLQDVIGSRLYFGKVKGQTRLGYYRQSNSEVRIAAYDDIEVMAHEMAHYLDYHYTRKGQFASRHLSRQLKNEVKQLSYTSDPKAVVSEGFAEFVRLWLTNYAAAKKAAPMFTAHFEAQLAKDPALQRKMEKLQDAGHRWFYQGSHAQLRAKSGEEYSSGEQVIRFMQSYPAERFRQETIDKIHAANVVERTLNGKIHDATRSAFKQFQMVNGAESVHDSVVNDGTVSVGADGTLVKSGIGLAKVFFPVAKHGWKRFDLLMDYFKARRASELMQQGRENLFTRAEIAAGLNLATQYPEFADVFQAFQEFNARMLDFYVQMHLITPDMRDAFAEANKSYVPFQRIGKQIAEGSGQGGGSTIGKRLKGGTQNVADIAENIVEGLFSNIRSAMIARAKNQLYSDIEKHQDGSLFAVRLAPDSKKVKAHISQMARTVATTMVELGIGVSKNGIIVNQGNVPSVIYDVDDITDVLEQHPDLLDVWMVNQPPQTDGDTFVDSAIIGGQKRYYEVKEPLLVDMLTGMRGLSSGVVLRALYSIKNFQTRAVTSWLQFIGPNAWRDTLSAAVLSKNNFIPVADTLIGIGHAILQTPLYKEMRRNGAGYGTRIEGRTEDMRARRALDLPARNGWDVAAKFLAGWDRFFSSFEYGSRMGDYRRGKLAGKNAMQAAWEAREITTDFSKTGRNEFWVKFMRTVPFMNAGIQGLDKTARELAQHNGKMTAANLVKLNKAKAVFLLKGGVITAMTTLLWLLNNDDDRYKALTEDERARFWWVWVPGLEKPIKIPRPYDIGHIFASIPEAMLNYVKDRNGKAAAEQLAWIAINTAPVGDYPGIMQPLVEVQLNRNFSGAPIVPNHMVDMPPQYQFTERTPQMWVKLGEAFGVSPLVAQHIANGYGRYATQFVEDVTEAMFWNEAEWGPRPFAKGGPVDMLTYQFIGRRVPYRTKWTEGYYNLKTRAAGMRSALSNMTAMAIKDGEPLNQLARDRYSMTLVALDTVFNQIDSAFEDQDAFLASVKYNPGLTAEEKERQIDDYYAQRNDTLARAYTQISNTLDQVEGELR